MPNLSASYWTNLADDYVAAWGRVFGDIPTKEAILIAMSVAEFETANGRAWVGANNWGAVQLRRLTPEELERFNEGTLTVNTRLPGNPGGVLHIDTTPTPSGPKSYPVWFATWATPADGIAYFLKVLLKSRPSCLAVLENPTKDDIEDLAEQMLLSGYYEGSHVNRPIAQRALPLTNDEQQNADDYAHNVAAKYANIAPMLDAWEPNDMTPTRVTIPSIPVAPYDLHTVRGYQAALTYLASKYGRPEWDPRGIDGIHGTDTDKAIRAFQAFEKIGVDGDMGPETEQKIYDAIASVPA